MTVSAETTAERVIARVEIASGTPSPTIVAELNAVCDAADDARSGFVVLDVRGRVQDARDPRYPDANLFTQWERAVRRFERLPAITVSVSAGECGWFETGLVLATDYRVASSSLRLSFRDGCGNVVPTMGTYRLAVQIGVARSRRYVCLGADMTAPEALDLGVVDAIGNDGEAALRTFIESAAAWNADDLAIRRRLLQESTYRSFEDALGTHLAARDRMVRKFSAS